MCVFKMYGETFRESGASILGNIFALERLIGLMPGYVFGFASVKQTSPTQDEKMLLECLALYQSGREGDAKRLFSREFNLTMPTMLQDLVREITHGFQQRSLEFGTPVTEPTIHQFERPAMVH